MTQEDKELLLKDLCARLIYGVKVEVNFTEGKKVKDLSGYADIINQDICVGCSWMPISDNIKPYLRPMSSMTEEEKRHISKMMCLRTYDDGVVHDMTYPVYTPYYVMEDCLSYLRSIHVDYSGLIEKDLALAAPEGMYEY